MGRESRPGVWFVPRSRCGGARGPGPSPPGHGSPARGSLARIASGGLDRASIPDGLDSGEVEAFLVGHVLNPPGAPHPAANKGGCSSTSASTPGLPVNPQSGHPASSAATEIRTPVLATVLDLRPAIMIFAFARRATRPAGRRRSSIRRADQPPGADHLSVPSGSPHSTGSGCRHDPCRRLSAVPRRAGAGSSPFWSQPEPGSAWSRKGRHLDRPPRIASVTETGTSTSGCRHRAV